VLTARNIMMSNVEIYFMACIQATEIFCNLNCLCIIRSFAICILYQILSWYVQGASGVQATNIMW